MKNALEIKTNDPLAQLLESLLQYPPSALNEVMGTKTIACYTQDDKKQLYFYLNTAMVEMLEFVCRKESREQMTNISSSVVAVLLTNPEFSLWLSPEDISLFCNSVKMGFIMVGTDRYEFKVHLAQLTPRDVIDWFNTYIEAKLAAGQLRDDEDKAIEFNNNVLSEEAVHASYEKQAEEGELSEKLRHIKRQCNGMIKNKLNGINDPWQQIILLRELWYELECEDTESLEYARNMVVDLGMNIKHRFDYDLITAFVSVMKDSAGFMVEAQENNNTIKYVSDSGFVLLEIGKINKLVDNEGTTEVTSTEQLNTLLLKYSSNK